VRSAVRPTATRLACAALAQLGLCRAARAARARCSTSRRRHSAGTRETVGNDGSPARRRRHGVTATGGRLRSERRGSDSGGRDGGCRGGGAWSEAVGEQAGARGTRSASGGREAAVGRGAAKARCAVGRGAAKVRRAVGTRDARSRQRLKAAVPTCQRFTN
jgi:hypothetical protein